MLIAPRALSSVAFTRGELKADKKDALHYGHCALGKRALYVGGYGLSCVAYIPLVRVKRVFKRLAVTKGFYEQNRIYATIPYLVVLYDDGKEKVVRFEHEEELELLLSAFRKHTAIPVGKA